MQVSNVIIKAFWLTNNINLDNLKVIGIENLNLQTFKKFHFLKLLSSKWFTCSC